jgi:hypothetical protein
MRRISWRAVFWASSYLAGDHCDKANHAQPGNEFHSAWVSMTVLWFSPGLHAQDDCFWLSALITYQQQTA